MIVASGWYVYARYQETSGASLRGQILQERKAKPQKDSNPKQTFYSMLDKFNLTPEQQAKMDATRDLPMDKDGWTQRKKVLAETLTDEQMQQLKQMHGGGDTRWEKSLRNLNEADQRAIQRRFEGLKRNPGKKPGSRGGKK